MQDKGELTSSSMLQAINSFQDILSSHKGLSTVNDVMWSPFYKKQNEIMIKELAKEYPDETSYSFPMYTEKKFEKGVSTGDWDWKKFGAISKKGVCKDPPVKPGDDWWIML